VLEMEVGNLLEVRGLETADIVLLETDLGATVYPDLCVLLRRMKSGARAFTYLDLRKIWGGGREARRRVGVFPFRQLEINRVVSDRYATSWSVNRGHHFYLWMKVLESGTDELVVPEGHPEPSEWVPDLGYEGEGGREGGRQQFEYLQQQQGGVYDRRRQRRPAGAAGAAAVASGGGASFLQRQHSSSSSLSYSPSREREEGGGGGGGREGGRGRSSSGGRSVLARWGRAMRRRLGGGGGGRGGGGGSSLSPGVGSLQRWQGGGRGEE